MSPSRVIDEYREIFHLVNREGGGVISLSEFEDLLGILGVSTNNLDSVAIAKIKGGIYFEELISILSRKISISHPYDDVKKSFKVFSHKEEHPKPGHIHVDTLADALSTCGSHEISRDRAMELVEQLESDGDGMVNYSEYVDMMTSG